MKMAVDVSVSFSPQELLHVQEITKGFAFPQKVYAVKGGVLHLHRYGAFTSPLRRLDPRPSFSRQCHLCRRRLLMESFGVLAPLPTNSEKALAVDGSAPFEKSHRPDWYEELYAISLKQGMKAYESEIAAYKEELFKPLLTEADTILDLGIGTGPNIKYYANKNVSVLGVDPNKHMEAYVKAEAGAAGLKESQFKFVCGVGEALPVVTASVDAVVCSLVLCSVNDVFKTLKEIQRVLKPQGKFYFIEHVAAPDSTPLRFWQELLDPIQQFVADGCHLTRKTQMFIEESGFSVVSAKRISISSVSLISPQIIGKANK